MGAKAGARVAPPVETPSGKVILSLKPVALSSNSTGTSFPVTSPQQMMKFIRREGSEHTETYNTINLKKLHILTFKQQQ